MILSPVKLGGGDNTDPRKMHHEKKHKKASFQIPPGAPRHVHFSAEEGYKKISHPLGKFPTLQKKCNLLAEIDGSLGQKYKETQRGKKAQKAKPTCQVENHWKN